MEEDRTEHEIRRHEALLQMAKKERRIEEARSRRDEATEERREKKRVEVDERREKRSRLKQSREMSRANEERRRNRSRLWGKRAFKPFGQLIERRYQEREKRRRMMKDDENWFEVNMVLAGFGGAEYKPREKRKVNIHANSKGPWKKPNQKEAQAFAYSWRMLDGLASLRTPVEHFDVWGSALRSYMILLRTLVVAFILMSVVAVPLITFNVMGNSLNHQYGKSNAHPSTRATLGNIGTSKRAATKMNRTYCEILDGNETLQKWVSTFPNHGELDQNENDVAFDSVRHTIEQDLIDSCLGSHVSASSATGNGDGTKLWEIQVAYTWLDGLCSVILFAAMTHVLHKTRGLDEDECDDVSDYSVYVTGYPKEQRPPDKAMRRRVATHMNNLFDLHKRFCAVDACNDGELKRYRPHGRSPAIASRELFHEKFVANLHFVFDNDAYIKGFRQIKPLYDGRRRWKMEAWKFDVGTEYDHGSSVTAYKGSTNKADDCAYKIMKINRKIDPIVYALPLHKKQMVQLKNRKQIQLQGVFVTFEHKLQQRMCFEEYRSSSRWTRWLCGERVASLHCCLRVPDRLKFKDKDDRLHTLHVSKAPSPGTILWEHWNVSWRRRAWGRCRTISICSLMSLLCLIALFVSHGYRDSRSLDVDYSRCHEDVAASYFSTYNDATRRSLERPKNPNRGTTFAIRTDRDRMCLNHSRQAYDFDNSKPVGEQAYFVGFWVDGSGEGAGEYWRDEVGYRPEIVDKYFEVFTPFGNEQRMLEFYNFTSAKDCDDPCWPGVNRSRTALCETRACVDVEHQNIPARWLERRRVRSCEKYWRGTLPACYCRDYVAEHLGLLRLGNFITFFQTQGALCSQFPFLLSDVSLMNTMILLCIANVLIVKYTPTIVDRFEFPRTTVERFERIASLIFRARFVVSVCLIPIAMFDGHRMVTDAWPSRETLRSYSLSWQPFFVGPSVGFDSSWYTHASPAMVLLLILSCAEPIVGHVVSFINHRLRLVRNRKEAPSQHDLNKLYEGPEVALVKWATRICSIVCFGLIFSAGVPIVYPLFALTLCVCFVVEKYYVLRFYSMRHVWQVPKRVITGCAHTIRATTVVRLFVSACMFTDNEVNYDVRIPINAREGMWERLDLIFLDIRRGEDDSFITRMLLRKNTLPCLLLALVLTIIAVVHNLRLASYVDPVTRHVNARRIRIRRLRDEELRDGVVYRDSRRMKRRAPFLSYWRSFWRTARSSEKVVPSHSTGIESPSTTILSGPKSRVVRDVTIPIGPKSRAARQSSVVLDEETKEAVGVSSKRDVEDVPETRREENERKPIEDKLPSSFYLFLTKDLVSKENWSMILAVLPICEMHAHEFENPYSRRASRVVKSNEIVAFTYAQLRRYRSGKHGWTVRGVTDETRRFVVLRKLWSESSSVRDVPHRRLHPVKFWEDQYLRGRPISFDLRHNPAYAFEHIASNAMLSRRRCVDAARDENIFANFMAVSRRQNELEASASSSECEDEAFFESCEFEWEKKAPLWKVQMFRYGMKVYIDDEGNRAMKWREDRDQAEPQTDEEAVRAQKRRLKAKEDLKKIEELQRKRLEKRREKRKVDIERSGDGEDVATKRRVRIGPASKKKRVVVAHKPVDRKVVSLSKQYPTKSIKHVIDALNAAKGITALARRVLNGEEVDCGKELGKERI